MGRTLWQERMVSQRTATSQVLTRASYQMGHPGGHTQGIRSCTMTGRRRSRSHQTLPEHLA
eukprot:1147170-Amphidinium_carterae.1